MTFDKTTYREKISEIVTQAVESRMDWNAYYSGDSPEYVEDIMDVFDTAITQALESVRFVENPEGAHDESDAACDWMAEQLNQKIDAILKGEQ